MALPTPPPVTNPIPNNPFFAPLNPFVCGPYFPVALGNGIDLTTGATVPQLVNQVQNVLAAGPGIALTTFLGVTTITSTGGGGGSGTVTSVTAGTGLTGGTITTSGTIALANTAVTAGAYTAADITVDAQGRITAAASGSGGSGIPCSTITGKGALVTGTAASTPTALAVGTDGYVLTACAACTEGLTWIASSGAAPATPIVEGIVFGCTDGATSFNTALGYNALLAPTATGIANVAIGTSAGNAVTDGYGNTLIGPATGCSVTTGTVNTAVGIGALCGVTSGSVNLGVGICSGCAYITESGNAVFGGYYGDPGDTNSLILSDGAGNLKAKFDSLGALSFDGTAYGTAGQVLSSNGAGAKPTWIAAGGSAATPTVAGIVLGCTTVSRTAIGCNALLSNTTGGNNVAIGVDALRSNTTGNYNVANGCGALFRNTTGCYNTATGVNALTCNTTGNCNAAIGICALYYNTAGSGNAAIGASALYNTTGCRNVGIGFSSASNLTTGCDNVVIGSCVQVASSTGCCQLAIGFSTTCNWLTGDSTKAIRPGAGIIDCAASTGTAGQVLMSNGSNAICWGTAGGASAATPTVAGVVKGFINATNTALGCNAAAVLAATGLSNTAIGNCAGFALDDACCNTLVGTSAGCALNFGLGHTVIGTGAGAAITTGFYNVFVGAEAGASATQDRNVFIGACAGCAQTTGRSNVAIGDGVNVPITTGGCQLAIGYSSAFACWLTGNNTGAIKPGAGIIDCANSCGTVGQYLWTTGTNRIIWSASSPSDTRDKEVLGPVPTALPIVQQIEPITYRWKERESDVAQEEVIYGFSAQQLQEVDAVLVDSSDPDHLRIHARKIVPLLVHAIQELSAKVEALEAKLEANG